MKIFLLSLFFISFISFSQNWNIVNPNRTVFFQHSDSTHITNTIVIDSSLINGANTNYYTGYAFKYCDTCAGFSYIDPIIYRYAKEFLGFNIENDVTNNQYNLDNNIVKQHSQNGDNWAFNSNLIATVINVGEQTILGILDSVKIIHLSNNDTIVISKNYGVIRYPDFENTGKHFDFVGYHEGQNSYGEYLPNFWRTYDFNVGDEFFYEIDNWYVADNYNRKMKIKILQNYSSANTISYRVKVIANVSSWGSTSYSTSNYDTTISIAYNKNLDENNFGCSKSDTTLDFYENNNYFYYPILSGNFYFQSSMELYKAYEINYNSTFGISKNLKHYYAISDSLLQTSTYVFDEQYINNLGRTVLHYFEFETINDEILVGTIINGDTTGTIFNLPDDLSIKENILQNKLKFYPNPATNQITLKGNYKSIAIYNNLGQVVIEQLNPNQVINVNHLSKGLYFIKGVDKNDVIYSGKLMIE